MKRLRRKLAILLLATVALLPLPGCTGGQANAFGSLVGLALGVGASVGTYFLLKELD